MSKSTLNRQQFNKKRKAWFNFWTPFLVSLGAKFTRPWCMFVRTFVAVLQTARAQESNETCYNMGGRSLCFVGRSSVRVFFCSDRQNLLSRLIKQDRTFSDMVARGIFICCLKVKWATIRGNSHRKAEEKMLRLILFPRSAIQNWEFFSLCSTPFIGEPFRMWVSVLLHL